MQPALGDLEPFILFHMWLILTQVFNSSLSAEDAAAGITDSSFTDVTNHYSNKLLST
jgi:hypothetical protein